MRLCLALLSLAACASSPAPSFLGAARDRVTLDGIDFTVFHAGTRAEVVRLGYLPRARRAGVPDLMARAAERVSGCRVIDGSMVTALPGDTGEARFDLDCRNLGG